VGSIGTTSFATASALVAEPMKENKATMNFEGYIDRIEFHFERMGVTARPSQQEYVDAWNNQIPAKKMAQTFARRHRRGGRRKSTRLIPQPHPCEIRS